MKIFAFILAFTFFSGVSIAQPLIFSQYKPSDQILISDIARRSMSKIPNEASKCPGDRCSWVSNSWAESLNENEVDKRFIASLASKPPHIKTQLLQAEFNARYQQLSNAYRDDICFDSSSWGLSNSNEAYYVGDRERNLFYVATKNFVGTEHIVPESGGVILQGIQNRFITEPVYARLQSLLGAGKSPSFIRACGRLTNNFLFPSDPNQPFALQPPMFILTLSRPMEIMRTSEGPGLRLPFEWFQK